MQRTTEVVTGEPIAATPLEVSRAPANRATPGMDSHVQVSYVSYRSTSCALTTSLATHIKMRVFSFTSTVIMRFHYDHSVLSYGVFVLYASRDLLA